MKIMKLALGTVVSLFICGTAFAYSTVIKIMTLYKIKVIVVNNPILLAKILS
ncbi:hypothetical protein [Candidatus Coxiella mudrowiae]|uniref:hypothetical protein n=1 Tax=Candidatus Coxiella mudrowiae TaxID=2054173 RepID=UPI0012FF4778|nr:hypothetical protein [Candidatus Coxiella mudrowiae]